jgi:hypothetical protein
VWKRASSIWGPDKLTVLPKANRIQPNTIR